MEGIILSLFLKNWVLLLPLFLLGIPHLCRAEDVQSMSDPHGQDNLLGRVVQWRAAQVASLQEKGLSVDFQTALAGVLCFFSASLSSAGGVGGGALFLPILNLVAGLDLKHATTFSAFMVTGGAISNVLYNMCFKRLDSSGKSLIDFDIALLSEPCMLLGVSLGVVCNVVFPEWLITLMFVVLLAFSTFKTCKAGMRYWKAETDGARRAECRKVGSVVREERIPIGDEVGGETGLELEEPLLGEEPAEGRSRVPWKRMVVLVVIWLAFFGVQTLRGNKDGKSMIEVEPCSTGYWFITLSQIPLAIFFSAYILYDKQKDDDQVLSHHSDFKGLAEETKVAKNLPKVLFPVAALLAGVLGGLFGIGGGLLMNPVLLHIGIQPQVAAATSSFMVLFSSSMSSVQYLMLGMKNTDQAAALAMGCFVASLIGLIIIQRAVEKYGRASLIVFTVSSVMALSTVSITCFGALDVWREYATGEYMGFNPPC